MYPEDGSTNQPKRRGRPPKLPAISHPLEEPTGWQIAQEEAPAEEQVELADEAYTLEEEQLSLFGSFLQNLLRKDHGEVARVANALSVSENTIYRWMNGNSVPRSMHLKNLIEVLPEHRNNLIYVINQTFPGVLDALATGLREVHKDIYRRVIELVAATADLETRRWHITQTIFEYALLHLDSDRRGLAITLARLMPAHEDGIHSLFESTMRGNYPWPFALENHAYLGSTTLAGMAAMLGRLQTWDNLDEDQRLQFEVDEHERSACAYPIVRGEKVAGVLIISSTQPDFFTNPVACQAVVEYAQLLGLAFYENDFVSISKLNFRPMPGLKWQRREINRSYINRIIKCSRQLGISRQEAELHTRIELEAEFEALGRRQYEQRRLHEEHQHT